MVIFLNSFCVKENRGNIHVSMYVLYIEKYLNWNPDQ